LREVRERLLADFVRHWVFVVKWLVAFSPQKFKCILCHLHFNYHVRGSVRYENRLGAVCRQFSPHCIFIGGNGAEGGKSFENVRIGQPVTVGHHAALREAPEDSLSLLDGVTPGHGLFAEELFGPVLGLMRPETLDQAIDWINRIPYGNAATIFTHDGGAARTFTREAECGMIGVNVGVPAPMALFSFSGWDQSFFGDLHVQGTEGILFYTRQKTVLSRWPRR